MINYPFNISQSGLSIYDTINPANSNLYIPTDALEIILANHMVGLSLEGLPLRTRSKVVKQKFVMPLAILFLVPLQKPSLVFLVKILMSIPRKV